MPPMTARPCSLAALAMVNALGGHPDEIWPRLIRGDQSGFRTREDLVPGRKLVVAEVTGALPAVPDRLRQYACRNNSLTLAALEQIEKPISDLILALGRDRIGVVMGTSTSGVSDAEIAIRQRVATGALARSFHYCPARVRGRRGLRGGAARARAAPPTRSRRRARRAPAPWSPRARCSPSASAMP